MEKTRANVLMWREATSHGFEILQRKLCDDGKSAIICAFRGPSAAVDGRQPFAIWRMEADGTCHSGDYLDTLAEAAKAFEDRRS